jgi:exodeoxyribonuclease VII small subunit
MTARPRSDADPDADPEAGGAGAPGTAAESAADASAGSFEASLDDLERIVDRLESGDLPLEAALAAFEEGVVLTRRCAEQLDAAERRIEVLVKEGTSWLERPFEEPEDSD